MTQTPTLSEREAQITKALAAMNNSDERYFSYGAIVWDALSDAEREQLKQLLFQGPVWDGCVVSKSARNQLIEYGLATRCCFMGEQGYTAATYIAFSVHKQGKGGKLQNKQGITG